MYGDEVSYEIELIEPGDLNELQAFSCGNEQLDKYIQSALVENGEVDVSDALPFKARIKDGKEIIAVFSLAASSIIYKVDNYTHQMPAIKIDILAVDKKYQKMHIDKDSEMAQDPNDHIYLSDKIMDEIIQKCRLVGEKMAAVNYILLYADKDALRYYRRNFFQDFSEFMVPEHNQEINKNYPMFLTL